MKKRTFDFILAGLILLVALPFLLLVGTLVRLFIGSPILFTQIRPGKNAKPFKLYKFRTMSNDKDEKGELLDDKDRLSRFGKFLRSTSLDELPSLFNVMKGDMSLVGPRPLLPEYIPLYSSYQYRRHEVRPGVTGWAQVNGRNAISWEDKFNLDVWYVENRSFRFDLTILFLTVRKVLVREGISGEGEETMSKFTGNKC
jgi:lipopolysaccharide/colanic/teichoic acid biosynthesis glycosyltransferase